MLAEAEGHIDSGDNLLYRRDYARARNEFAAAISDIGDACRVWEANRERDERNARHRSIYETLDRQVTNTLASARRSFSGHTPQEVDRQADVAIAEQERAASYAARGDYEQAVELLEEARRYAARAEQIAQNYEYEERHHDHGRGEGRVVNANHHPSYRSRGGRGRSW
jgi:tetratricopeptide (TPR) repeat protein